MAFPSYFKLEEIPVVAKFIYNSYIRDENDFKDYSSAVFTVLFGPNYLAKITEVERLTGLLAYWARSGMITASLYKNVDELRPIVNKLEGYVIFAGSLLNVEVKKFGIIDLRKDINANNVEGVIAKLELILQNTESNNGALTGKGLKPELVARIRDKKTAIAGLNEQQQLINTEKDEALKNNWEIIGELWDIAFVVITAGKAMYRIENKEKVKDYTPAQLKKRVNAERGSEPPAETVVEKGVLVVMATNKSNDEDLEGADVLIVETGNTDMTDADGEGMLEEKPGTYIVKVKMDGFKDVEIRNVIIKQGETTQLNVAMEPVAPAEP